MGARNRTTPKRLPSAANRFGEKSFYLDEFRGQTLSIAVSEDAVRRTRDASALIAAAVDLLRHGARVLLVWGAAQQPSPRILDQVLARIGRSVGARLHGAIVPVADGARARISVPFLGRVWRTLRQNAVAVVSVGATDGALADFAQRLVVRLGVRKLVLIDSEGGITNDAGLLSFMDGDMLDELLRRGEAEWFEVGHRRRVLEGVRAALHGGVESVNLCSLEGAERELFTYEGAGTLFTLQDYCRVERLRVDEFREVEKLLERGVHEGYLRPRRPREIAEILMCGYGATIGAGHLAGVCALATEPYRSERAGEVVGLYTITRFKGEGVGGKLLERVIEDGRQLGLDYMFACTIHDRARAFFSRHGFRRVTADEVPVQKWRTYKPARRRDLTILKLPLAPTVWRRRG